MTTPKELDALERRLNNENVWWADFNEVANETFTALVAELRDTLKVVEAVREMVEEWRSPRTGELDLTGEEGLVKVVAALDALKKK